MKNLVICKKKSNFAALFTNGLSMQKLVLIAEEGERQLIEKYLPETDWEVLVTGVGALNIIRALQELPRDTQLLNIGYCGSANFEVGSTVVVTEARLNHPNVTYPEPVLMLEDVSEKIVCAGMESQHEPLKAVCYSNTDFVLQSDYKDCVFDMELAYIVAQGFQHVSAIKIVSDNLSLHAYHELTNGVE